MGNYLRPLVPKEEVEIGPGFSPCNTGPIRMELQPLGQVFLSLGISACGGESLSQGLKPHLSAVLNVRAKARTYLRSKDKSKSRYLRFVRHYLVQRPLLRREPLY